MFASRWLEETHHMTISHAEAEYWIRVAAVRGECFNTAQSQTALCDTKYVNTKR